VELTEYQKLALSLIEKEILRLEIELIKLKEAKQRILRGEPKLRGE